MLTGMLPRLTVVAQAEEQGRKIDLTESSVSHHGTTADNTRPKRWVVDGDRTQANYFVTGNDQPQTANTENPANPGYWLQLDLGQKYSITKLNLCIYYDGRYLKDLVVLASNEAEFTKENSQVVYNADSNNFFGLGAGTDLEMPAQNNSAGFDITPTPVVEAQYLRIFNNGNSKNDGAHWIEVEVYGTETTGQPMLHNVANGRKATVNKDGSVDPNRPASLMTDGDKRVGQYTEISRDKVQDKNDPSYAQIDLGDVYPISRVNFWNYWADGRTLKDLKIILSEDPHFNNATTIYSQDYTATEQGLRPHLKILSVPAISGCGTTDTTRGTVATTSRSRHGARRPSGPCSRSPSSWAEFSISRPIPPMGRTEKVSPTRMSLTLPRSRALAAQRWTPGAAIATGWR